MSARFEARRCARYMVGRNASSATFGIVEHRDGGVYECVSAAGRPLRFRSLEAAQRRALKLEREHGGRS